MHFSKILLLPIALALAEEANPISSLENAASSGIVSVLSSDASSALAHITGTDSSIPNPSTTDGHVVLSKLSTAVTGVKDGAAGPTNGPLIAGGMLGAGVAVLAML